MIRLSLWRAACFKFLGTFAKLRKATISLIAPVRLSVRMEQLGTYRADFNET